MKKIVSSILACVLLLSCVLVLASCSKTLNGTYAHEESTFGIKTEIAYEFKGDKVTIKGSIAGVAYEFDGTYEIDGEKINITLEEVIGSAEYSGTFDFNEGVDNDGAYIEIDGLKLYKK